MECPRYPGTGIAVRRGDLVRWHNDEAPSRAVFVVSTGDFSEEDMNSKEWFQAEFGQSIMIDTPGAGWVLESEDCGNIELVRSVSQNA